MLEESWGEQIREIENNEDDYFEIRKMTSRESFLVMEIFAKQVDDSKLQKHLFEALDKKGPFREFNFVIGNSGDYRQMWFDFRHQQNIAFIKSQIKRMLEEDGSI